MRVGSITHRFAMVYHSKCMHDQSLHVEVQEFGTPET